MIKATPKKITEGLAALNLMMSPSVKLPAKAAYGLGKLAKACNAEMKDYGEARNKVFEQHGCTLKGPEGKQEWTHEDPEKLKAAIAEADQLADVEVELNAIPLDLEQFGNAEVPGAFFGLDWAMKE